MAKSEGRRFLSALYRAFGVNGILVVRNGDAVPDDAGTDDAAPDAAPEAESGPPRCECGHSMCPDFDPVSAREELSARVARVNRRSRGECL